ncbi:hypothetical protein [Pantoea piersonii]|uniref:hypothetical protein n=1 Tax=Pantoea piersonii TaxID=2364647 RepID=UPI002896A127|nr:hypothetical protein [Pantoea piersonii]
MAKLRITVSGLEWAQDDSLHHASAEVIVKQAGKEIVREEFSGEAAGHYSRDYDVNSSEGELQVTWETDAPHFECKAEIIETE